MKTKTKTDPAVLDLNPITFETLAALQKAREVQTLRARSASSVQAAPLSEGAPQLRRDVCPVRIVNGHTVDTAIPLARVMAWAKSHGAGARFALAVETDRATLRREDPPAGCNLSLLCFTHYRERVPGPADKPHAWAALADFGAPLPLVARDAGDAFELAPGAGGQAADLATLRETARAAGRAARHARALANARDAERQALHGLRKAAGEARAARKVLADTSKTAAVAYARRALAAARVRNAFERDPTVAPAWLANVPTFTDREFIGTDGDGNPWIDRTADTAAEFATLHRLFAYQVAERDRYKPAMTRPRWPGDERRPILGPKWDHLTGQIGKAREKLRNFLAERFAEWLRAQGLPDSLRWNFHAWRSPYGAARRLLTGWPERKRRAGGAYVEALEARRAIEAKAKAA